MFENLKPYPKYRNAEGEWLGKVPEHWSVKRVKYLLSEVDSRSTTGKEQLLRVSQYSGVTQRVSKDGSDGPDTRAESLVGYKQVVPNNLVINIMLAWNGSMGVSKFSGIASPAYCVYNFRKNSLPWYYHHLLRSPIYKARIKALSTGVVESRLRLYTDSFFGMEAILPPTEEQEAIVRFLDHANAKLEKAIRSKKKIIALLNEQKQAIIHQAVTKGLDPKVKMKDSGIPWLGEIPAHWEVVKLGRKIDLQTGFPFKSNEFSSENKGIRLLRGINVTPQGIRWSSCVWWDNKHNIRLDEFSLSPGDLVLGMDRPIVSTGVRVSIVAESDTPSFLLQRVARLRPNNSLHGMYLFFVLHGNNFKEYMTPIFSGISVPHLSPDQIKQFPLPAPSKKEQQEIVRYLESQLIGINQCIDSQQGEVDILQEYRTRLIADVVTGKLDVREAAKNLPLEVQVVDDAVDEDETIDEEGNSDE